MSAWYILPAMLGLAITIVLWMAVRLVLWARAPQNIAAACFLGAMACVFAGYLYQLVLSDYTAILFWSNFQAIGYFLLYPLWFIFVLYFTGHKAWVTPRMLLLLGILAFLPIAAMLLPATSSWMATTVGFVPTPGPFKILEQADGWMTWAFSFFAQVEGVISLLLLIRHAQRVRTTYRKYFIILNVAICLTCLAVFAQMTGANPIAPFSLITLTFLPSSLVICWVFYTLRVGQTLPVIREQVVEAMRDSVIVLDSQHKLVYLNPAAYEILQAGGRPVLGRPLVDVVPSGLADRLLDPHTREKTLVMGDQVYSTSQSTLEDWKGEAIGQVLVARNVTDREQLEQAVQARATELARSSAFTVALSLVAARVAVSADLDQVYKTLSIELHRIQLYFLVAVRNPGEPGYRIDYVSISGPVLQQMEELTGQSAKGFQVPELADFFGQSRPEQGEAQFFPNFNQVIREFLPDVAVVYQQDLMDAAGITLQTAGFVFRLIAGQKEVGMFAVWGPTLRQDDWSPLSVFAAQVSAAIQKIRLIQSEQERVAELERTNLEKEALLKEIHHRVKNNLQIISSLLNLQSQQVQDDKVEEIFRESQNRIRSMALIHEKLYRSDNLARVKFDEYIHDLGMFLVRAYNDPDRQIRLEVRADHVDFDLDTAIPCSLIVNELVSNSLKHGFPPALCSGIDMDRRICVELAWQSDRKIHLVVEDNGVGYPTHMDFQRTGSLGLQLVHSLAQQLAGEIEFSNRGGARAEIAFPVE